MFFIVIVIRERNIPSLVFPLSKKTEEGFLPSTRDLILKRQRNFSCDIDSLYNIVFFLDYRVHSQGPYTSINIHTL